MTDWITARPPTEADADCNGNVEHSYLCALNGIKNEYINWRLLTSGFVWRHTSLWKPPTPEPEPTPAAPEFRVGQVWRTREGRARVIIGIEADSRFPIWTDLYSLHCYNLYGKSVLGEGTDYRDDLVELISDNPLQPEPVVTTSTPATPEPEPEKATRGFARIILSPNTEEQYAISTDGTAWRRFVVCGEWENWEQVTPLPQPGEE